MDEMFIDGLEEEVDYEDRENTEFTTHPRMPEQR